MAENKEYITCEQKDGAVHISEEVIATIAAVTVNEVEGVCGLSANLGSDIAEMLGKKSLGKGVKIAVDENDTIELECNIVVLYGYSVVEVAKKVQDAVATAVESMTGMCVNGVNVNVCGISLPKTDVKK